MEPGKKQQETHEYNIENFVDGIKVNILQDPAKVLRTRRALSRLVLTQLIAVSEEYTQHRENWPGGRIIQDNYCADLNSGMSEVLALMEGLDELLENMMVDLQGEVLGLKA